MKTGIGNGGLGVGLSRLAIVGALLSASWAFGAIDGKVINQTTGKPQAGATVTLYKLGQAGPEQVESVKSGANGIFHITQDAQGPGPRLVQAAYDGVTYNHMLPPGSPSNDVTVDVYDSSKQPGDAKVSQHMVLLEPARGELMVSEWYLFRNGGKTTYNDVDGGTLKFYLPPATNGAVKINATAPQGMPVPQSADKTSKANVYKLAFPIKPGETRIDLTYTLPFTQPGPFESKILYKGGPTRLVVPNGVTLKGDGIQSIGQEPKTQANIYDVSGSDFKVEVAGTGSLRQAEAGDSGSDESSGPSFDEIPPKVYGSMKWILVLAFSILALGFTLLYRSHVPATAPTAAREKAPPTAKEKNARRR
ncbi:MAG TPA: hypothetical protein VLX58_10955 [Bryobacteraceae bacterium]|nr:hypothetical protein [Bryobacteraceae bacterium]